MRERADGMRLGTTTRRFGGIAGACLLAATCLMNTACAGGEQLQQEEPQQSTSVEKPMAPKKSEEDGTTEDQTVSEGTEASANKESSTGAEEAVRRREEILSRFEDADASQFVLADSFSRRYEPEELVDMSSWELRVARNEIYARYGYRFESDDLREHFEACPWYEPSTPVGEFDQSLLSDTEKANVALIVAIEAPRGLGGKLLSANYVPEPKTTDRLPSRLHGTVYSGSVAGDIVTVSGDWEVLESDGDEDGEFTESHDWVLVMTPDTKVEGWAMSPDTLEMEPFDMRDKLTEYFEHPSGLLMEVRLNGDGTVNSIGWWS